MSTIDAAIIKALVEHVGGDSSGIPDGAIGGKTYTAGDGIDITNDAISVKYDENSMELKDGKLAAKGGDTNLTTAAQRLNVNYTSSAMTGINIPAETSLDIPLGSFLVINNNGTKKKYVVVESHIDSNGNSNYRIQNVDGGEWKSMSYILDYKKYQIIGIAHTGSFTEEYGLFYRGTSSTNATEVITADEFRALLHYFNSQLSTST